MSKLEEAKKIYNSNNFSDAIPILDEYLNENPNHAEALFFRGICHRKIEKFNESIADFTAVINKLPDQANIYSERGVSYYRLKDYEAAVLDLNKAVELEPENPFRYSSRAYIRAYIDIDGAIDDYEKAIELDPKDEIAYNNLGLLQENQGHMKKAQQNFKKNNELSGYNPEKREPLPEVKKDTTAQEKPTFWGVIKQLLTSKETQKEFGNFIKSGFKKKD